MADIFTVGPKGIEFIRRGLREAEKNVTATGSGTNGTAGNTFTFRIAGDWSQRGEESAYSCDAHRIVFRGGEYIEDEALAYRLYSPGSMNDKPSDITIGSMVRAIYAGNWELVGGGGGARPIYGTIMEAVPANENNDAKLPAFGKVRVDGKTYETADGEIQYDHCGCWELAHQSNERLVVGMSVKLTGPHTHVETVDGEEKTTVYYLAVETPGGYISKLNEQLESDGTATITIRNGDEDTLFTVRGTVLGPDDYMKSGSGVHVHRTVGKNGTWLEVTAGDCPAHHEDDEESAI